MTRVVQKFGGSSVADAASIKRVARRVAATKQAGNDVVVVISAMGDTTDDLMDLALEVSPQPAPRELDMLLTTGERQSAALLAMALSDLGIPARSYTGSQAGVITTAAHGNARIIDITPGRIEKSLEAGDVVIVAGFQGVSQTTKDVTTLGRGASDTTAVALASSLGADFCEIYSDVDGVFTADPRIITGARRIPEISYEEMLEMAACGAKILHLRCVEYARREDVPVHVRSSFSDKPGTWVKDLADITKGSDMEEAIISGVAHDRSEAKITVAGIPDAVGRAAQIFDIVARADINIDMIVQNASRVMNGRTDLSFTLPRAGIVGVIGPNGVGKTTLFKTIVGLEKADSGDLKVGETVSFSYVDQNRTGIDPEKNVWEVVSDGLDYIKVANFEEPSRAYVASFGFKGPDQQKKSDRKSTRLNSSHLTRSRMPSSA